MTPDNILPAFVAYDEITSCTPYGSGHIHQTYKVVLQHKEKEQTYILQRINKQVFQQPEQVMSNLFGISQYLQQQSKYPLTVLQALPSNDGNSWHRDAAGEYWRLFPFIPNTISFDRPENPKQARAAAKAFGTFLRALRKFDVGQLAYTIPGFHDSLQRMQHFWKVVQKATPQRIFAAKKEVELLSDNVKIFHRIKALNLPQRVVHNDTKINNVLFDETTQEAVCVIDLDTVMPGTVLSDFGDMVRTFTPTVSEEEDGTVNIDVDIFEALTEGFLAAIGKELTPTEREHLVDGALWITLEQALRFLTDYLAGDVYYKINHPEHNLKRAKNQFQLFQAMQQREDLLRMVVESAAAKR